MTGDKLGPNLKFLTGKSISIFLVCGITIKGILIGFDQFMNLVVENTIFTFGKQNEYVGSIIIRGNEICVIELNQE